MKLLNMSLCRLVQIASDLEADGAYTSAGSIRNAALEIAMLREELETLRRLVKEALLPPQT